MSNPTSCRPHHPLRCSPLHDSRSTPSILLALVALCIVQRLRPTWVAVSVVEAARSVRENPERASRLCSRAIGLFQATVDTLCRRGRPARPTSHETNSGELELSRALLGVTTTLLGHVKLRRPALRELVVGAWLRLQSEVPALTQARFCEALSLSDRTLRHWLTRPRHDSPPKVLPEPAPAPKKRSRRQRRPRFVFDLVVPGTQLGADTTDTCAFGVPLKLMAAQDIGGRDEQLFESVLVDDHESAEHVVRVLTDALRGREGMQVITDQGTPYLAEATRAALEDAAAEHAPQREGDPLGKATVERAFETLKGIARPLLSITNRMAAAIPSLSDKALALATARVVFTALLRAYQTGARAARVALSARGSMDEQTLARAAAKARDAARADETSRRMLLQHIHAIYQFDVPVSKFVRFFLRYPLAVLRDAETALRPQLHRNDIRSLFRYFAALVRSAFAEHCRERSRLEHEAQQQAASQAETARYHAQQQRWLDDPCSWLRDALDALASQWIPSTDSLLFGGEGLGLAWLRRALARLVVLHGLASTTDIVTGALADIQLRRRDRLGDHGLDAVGRLVRRELDRICAQRHATPNTHCPPSGNSATLWNIGQTSRPPPPNPLPI